MNTFKKSLFVLIALVAFSLSSLAQTATGPKRFRGTIERISSEKIIFKEALQCLQLISSSSRIAPVSRGSRSPLP